MISFKDIGFVNSRELFDQAYLGKYAIGAFNFVCLEQMLSILEAAMKTGSPFILQCSSNVSRYIHPVMARQMASACIEIMKTEGKEVPMVLHLDHGTSFEDCVAAVQGGFSSVMFDGSALPYEENVRQTARVAEYAHQYEVSVEGELGTLSGKEEHIHHSGSIFTDPDAVEDFVSRTGVDSLAISIGTSHGVVKMQRNPDGSLPRLRFDILERIEKILPGFPIVLHGASSIPEKYVNMLNQFGGKLEEAVGIPAEQVREAVRRAVCKVNIASDGWITMTATTRRILAEESSIIDPRKFLAPSREAMTKVYAHKMAEVLGCSKRVKY